ncbi:MAG: ATP-binding protein [Verrucomicrobia bacterium]|nr:ATP-binding protein [Verrucomicrobiota bacterium]
MDIRERASHLVSLIIKDLPGITLHDLSHLDSLWETASLVAGDKYPVNPAEAFVFGAAVLLHDAAMCVAAYPGGLAQIKQTYEWKDAVAGHLRNKCEELPDESVLENPLQEIAEAALFDALRALHAKQARQLPRIEWPQPTGRKELLIQDSDLREFYGDIIGRLAESHWCFVQDLPRLPQRVNAGPGVPSAWHIHPLKVACLLRVADAAQIDHRRAPRFLSALLRPSGDSGKHWTFQSKLGKPSVQKNMLIYTGPAFDVEDAEAWWLCFDTLGMIDRELRSVHSLLDTYAIPPLRATGVKGVGSPDTLAQYIPTERWRPVNTGLRVSDVPGLVELFGGERLYGSDPTVAVRELIQNAADAIRARRILTDLGPEVGTIVVKLRKQNDETWLDVEDDGVGMSAAVLTGALLDFGRPFWQGVGVRQEFPGLISKGMKPTGRYGIGFFSVFMLGDSVKVTTRRYDAGVSETHTLEFRKGLRVRPILREASRDEALHGPGTRVSVKLSIPPHVPRGLLHHRLSSVKTETGIPLCEVVAGVAPSLDVTIEVEEGTSKAVAVKAKDWRRIDGKELLFRIDPQAAPSEKQSSDIFGANLRPLQDSAGRFFGRACIQPGDRHFSTRGLVTVGGFKSADLNHFGGILLGDTQAVARDVAIPIVPANVLRAWATEQAELLAKTRISDRLKAHGTAVVMALGGEVGILPIVIRDEDYLNAQMVTEIVSTASEIDVYSGVKIEFDEDEDDVHPREFRLHFKPSSELFFLPEFSQGILRVGSQNWPGCLPNLCPPDSPKCFRDALEQVLWKVWNVEPVCEEEERIVGKVQGHAIRRAVDVYSKPSSH